MTLDEFNETAESATTLSEGGSYFTYDEKNYCPFCGAEVVKKDMVYDVCSNNCPGSKFMTALYKDKLRKLHIAQKEYYFLCERIKNAAKRQLAKKYEEEIYPGLIREEQNNLAAIQNSIDNEDTYDKEIGSRTL